MKTPAAALVLALLAMILTTSPSGASDHPMSSPVPQAVCTQGLALLPEGAAPEPTAPAASSPLPAAALFACGPSVYGEPCDRNFDCRGYTCNFQEFRHCYGGTGSGCLGDCGCL
jgi:hypothetical protein